MQLLSTSAFLSLYELISRFAKGYMPYMKELLHLCCREDFKPKFQAYQQLFATDYALIVVTSQQKSRK